MFDKLAQRNVKRQLSSYLIYFVTVTLTIAMMFALCNVIYSDEVLSYALNMKNLMRTLIGISVFISIVVACVLGYATSFMLKLRKHEFGMYLTLGMTRKDIIKMFAFENLIIGAFAMVSGLFLGIFLYQGLLGLLARILDLKVFLGSYSFSGLLLTVILTVAMFLLSTISSAFYLKKASIYELLHGKSVTTVQEKHPLFWGGITFLSFIGIVYSLILCHKSIYHMFHSSNEEGASATELMLGLFILCLFVIIYHIGFTRSSMSLLLKSRKLKCQSTNTFVLRQLNGQLKSNSIQCGLLSFLVLAAIIGSTVSFGNKATVDQSVSMELPFDITVNLTANKDAPFSYPESKKIISSFVPIQEEIPYTVYTSNNGYLLSFTPYTGENYKGLHDSFMKESDFNQLITKLGYEPVSLDQEYLMIAHQSSIVNCDLSHAILNLNDTDYHLNAVTDSYPAFSNVYCYAVVPDEAVVGMDVETEYVAIDVIDQKFDAQELELALTYQTLQEDNIDSSRCNYMIRACYELEENSMSAILIVASLYLSLIFIFLAIAIMTMKLLSEVANDKKRYELLYRLGVSETDQKKALFQQISSFFFIPFFLPVILSIPIAYLCGRIVYYNGFTTMVVMMYQITATIDVILIIIQALYFLATYTVEKRNVLH